MVCCMLFLFADDTDLTAILTGTCSRWRIGANQSVTDNLSGEELTGRWAKCEMLDSSGYCVLKNAVAVSVKGD